MDASPGAVRTSGLRPLSTAAATNAWFQSATDSEGRLQWPSVSAWRCYSAKVMAVDTRDAAIECSRGLGCVSTTREEGLEWAWRWKRRARVDVEDIE
jgi:hypothetical protein